MWKRKGLLTFLEGVKQMKVKRMTNEHFNKKSDSFLTRKMKIVGV